MLVVGVHCMAPLNQFSCYGAIEITVVLLLLLLLARDVIYTYRAYVTMSVSICLSVCL